jgi:hypothetical protein
MRDEGGTARERLESLYQARARQRGTGLSDFERQSLDQLRAAEETWGKIIEAVQELLSLPPVLGGDADQQETLAARLAQAHAGTGDAAESIGQGIWPSASELIGSPTGLAQYQSLVMLTGVVAWFSKESGRSEAEILDRLRLDFPS